MNDEVPRGNKGGRGGVSGQLIGTLGVHLQEHMGKDKY